MNQSVKEEILKVLHYYDYFKHPLNVDEVYRFCAQKLEIEEVENALNQLQKQGEVVHKSGFWALKNREEIIDHRIENLSLNDLMLKRSKYVTWVLRQIPFVKGIGISGSLSKSGATPGSDIDFFLITSKNRVWLVKSIAILIKKYFCLTAINTCVLIIYWPKIIWS